MKKLGASLVLLMIPAVFILASVAPASSFDVFPVCIGLKSAGLGSASIELTLFGTLYGITVTNGAFVHLVGQARFSQAIPPPDGLVIYSVSGTATRMPMAFGSPSAAQGMTSPTWCSTAPSPFS